MDCHHLSSWPWNPPCTFSRRPFVMKVGSHGEVSCNKNPYSGRNLKTHVAFIATPLHCTLLYKMIFLGLILDSSVGKFSIFWIDVLRSVAHSVMVENTEILRIGGSFGACYCMVFSIELLRSWCQRCVHKDIFCAICERFHACNLVRVLPKGHMRGRISGGIRRS